MAVAMNIQNASSITTLDALWTLVRSQKKSVQRALAQRINESLDAERLPKVKMTEEEFYEKIDRSIASAKEGHIIGMREDESTDQFIDRLLCTE